MGVNPSFFKGATNLPVDKVPFEDALEYCRRLSERERGAGRLPARYAYRLPTEAEWEYACRAGSTNFFCFGNDLEKLGNHAWTAENSNDKTQSVGQKAPNAWGLHDMHGNLWEWCSDWFGQYPQGDLIDPAGSAEGEFKVFRGGGWYHEGPYSMVHNRFMMKPGMAINFVGFRVMLAASEP